MPTLAIPSPSATPTLPAATNTAPTPTPVLQLVVRPGNPLATRHYRVGVVGVDMWGSVQTLDGAAALLPLSGSSYLARTDHSAGSEPSFWIVDIDEGASTLPGMQVVLDVDPVQRTILIRDGSRLAVVSYEGDEIGSTDAFPEQAVLLADGSACWIETGKLVRWSPTAGGARSTSDVGSEFMDATLVAAGNRLILAHENGPALLVDPATGAQIGDGWNQGYLSAIAVSPDGGRFAVGVQDEEQIRATLEIRDAGSGAVLGSSVRPSDEQGYIESIAWLTEDVLMVLRTTTGSAIEPIPELRLASDLSTVSNIDPITPWMSLRAQRGPWLLVGGWGANVLLLQARVDQTAPPRTARGLLPSATQ